MGISYSAIMRFLLLAALVGLLQAELVVKQLHIQEHGTEYTQTITLDYERNIQTLEVPAHNNIVHSKTIFDFNQGVLFGVSPREQHLLHEGYSCRSSFYGEVCRIP